MFNINNWGSDTSNIKNSLGGPAYFRYYNEENNDITAAGYFPDSLRLKLGDRIVVIPQDTDATDVLYVVTAVVNGTPTVAPATGVDSELPSQTGHSGEFLTTDGTDASWGSVSFPVSSVNNKTGAVTLTASDVDAVPQLSTLPTAGVDYLGQVVQFVGTTGTYTNGYFYKCVSDGQDPATYSWTQVSVQPAPSGLPDQTGQSGKFLTTDGTDASWSDKPLVNTATGTKALTVLGSASPTYGAINIGAGSNSTNGNSGVAIGDSAVCSGSEAVAIGRSTNVSALGCVAIGHFAKATANQAIQLGATASYNTNSDANTFKVANANGNFELMNANGNLPADRLASTTGLADGNYRLRLTMASGVATLSWVAE